jgi:neutral ceramidase
MLAEKSEGLLAGWGSAEITPVPPCPMGGYAARSAPAESILDPLYAQALVFGSAETGTASLGVVICDLLEIPGDLLQLVRQRAAALFPGLTLWLGATHTHSGPALPQRLAAAGASTVTPEMPAAPLIEQITTGVLAALRSAVATLRPVRLAWASGQTQGIVTNRDHPGSGEDTALDLLCLSAETPAALPASGEQEEPADGIAEEEQRPPFAAIVGSFPCHPTVLSAANLALSADLPGAFRRHLRRLLSSECWVMLATGAAGDMSTRHTRRGQDTAELERLGSLLAHQAERLVRSARPLAAGAPRVRRTTLELPLKEPPAPELLATYEQQLQEGLAQALHADQHAQARTLETALQGIRALRSMRLSPELIERQVELAVARLGELTLVAVPGELYNRLGVAIRQASGQPVLLFGYTNGYAGYLPVREAYGAIDYEVLVSPFAPGAGEQVVQALQTLLNAGE